MSVSKVVAASTDAAVVGLFKIAALPSNVASLQTLDPKQKLKKGPKPPYVLTNTVESDGEASLITGRGNVLAHISDLAGTIGKNLSGMNAEEKANVSQWQSYAQTHVVPAVYRNDEATTEAVLKNVENQLSQTSYIATSNVSVADVVLSSALASFAPKFEANGMTHKSTQKWFDNLTNVSDGAICAIAPAPSKGGDKNAKKKEAKNADKKKEKATKQEKKPVEPEHPPLSLIDIRVGQIVDIKAHPDADSLYVETMECGEETPRTIISGLVKFQSLEQMMNRKVLVVCNMKPVKMRGIFSEGMVLCAGNSDKSAVEPLSVPDACKPGDLVTFDGYERCPIPQMPPKKKIFEAVQPLLSVDANGNAVFDGQTSFMTPHGPVTCTKLPNATIS
eukprot:CFRG3381T1